MSRHPSAPCFRLLLCGAVAVLTISGCRSNERQAREQDRYFRQDPREVPEARRNRLENEPTAFLRSRAHHPIHWQPWSAELFEHALVEQKPVFALVTTGAYRGTRTLLDRLKEDPTMTRTLNTHYLCSLVDLQAHPEFALYCKLLAREINRPVQFPFMIWLSHEGNPIAWLPLSTGDVASFAEVFANSHGMIKRIWKDDPRYVVTNSRSDNDHRVVRIEKGLSRKTTSKLSHLEARHKAGRALSALYDPTSQSIDGAGGLVPFSLLQFASGLAAEPATPDTLRDRLTDLARGHVGLLLDSAAHDPLEGGFFRARQSRGWVLPVFVKDAITQIEGVIACASLAHLADRQSHLATAKDLLNYLETRFVDEKTGGVALFEFPAPQEATAGAYLWSREDLQELIPEEEFPVVEKCYGISGLGNIPIEADPQRNLFRLNSLHAAMTPEAAASDLGITAERARKLLASARQRLRSHRRQLLQAGGQTVEPTPVTSVNARFAVALAELGAVSNDPELLQRAQKVLRFLRQSHYTGDGGLMRIAPTSTRRGIPARGIDYATLLDALFRVYRHDLDPRHLVWAARLGREVLGNHSDTEGLLLEVPGKDRILTVPLYDPAMIVGNSAWGIIYGPLQRLHQLTGAEEFETARAAVAARLLEAFERNPLIHTDFGIASQAAQRDTLVCLDGPRDDPEFARLHRVVREPQFAGITVVHLDPVLSQALDLPGPGSVTRAIVRRGGEQTTTAATAGELRTLLEAPRPE